MIFPDEKKFNLDGPDGFNSYWRDLRKEPRYFSKRNFGGGSVVCWAAFSVGGKAQIAFTSHRMDSAEYIQVLGAHLKPFWDHIFEEGICFQQDNAAIHTSRATQAWLASKNIQYLEWPACSLDQNPMENLWGIIVRRVYANNRQYQSVHSLKEAIEVAWNSIEEGTMQNLIQSMPNRIFQLIERHGGATDY